VHAVVRTCSGKGAKMSRGKSHATELCASEGRSVFARCGILSRGQFGARSTTSPQSRKRLLVSRSGPTNRKCPVKTLTSAIPIVSD
jgi:hypothetical protein